MALSKNDQASVREYLLGKLNDDEQQKIEDRLIVEDDLFEEFEVSKGELVEEYCAGELNQNERQWFECHFLASTEGRERYALAIAFGCLESGSRSVTPRRSFFQRLRDLVQMNTWLMATATSAAVVVVAVVSWFMVRPAGQTVIGPTLASTVMTREAGELPTKITLPPNTARLKIRLLLPQPSAPDTRYEAKLDDRSEYKPVQIVESDANSVWVEIPISLLPRGEYSLTLTASTSEGTPREIPGYNFNIE